MFEQTKFIQASMMTAIKNIVTETLYNENVNVIFQIVENCECHAFTKILSFFSCLNGAEETTFEKNIIFQQACSLSIPKDMTEVCS